MLHSNFAPCERNIVESCSYQVSKAKDVNEMTLERPEALSAEDVERIRDSLDRRAWCLNPTCEAHARGDESGLISSKEGRGRPGQFCSARCRMQFNYRKERLLETWKQIEWSKMQDPPPAPARELQRIQSHIEWLLLRYGVAEAWSNGGAPEHPRLLSSVFVSRDSLPEDWETALRDLAAALRFYKRFRLPEDVIAAVRNLPAYALELVPYYRWLAEQKGGDLAQPGREVAETGLDEA